MYLNENSYPKSVFFIITNEFCERFSYYGMKAVLALYLRNALGYGESASTEIYHAFSFLCYFTPLLGAFLADSLLGKFRTILYLSMVYAAGNVILSLAATPPLHLPASTFSMIGLLLIALGTGGIKPCVSAFGGDQFNLPQQAQQLSVYFSVFYFSINAGSLMSTVITPYFRKDVECFGSDSCYPLAFGVPALLMVVALIVFVVGKPWYKCREPEGNITVEVGKCINHALREKSKSHLVKDHWLDYAGSKYDSDLIESTKRLLKILVLYLPLPFFWALFDQQGSTWTFQASRMNGDFGLISVKPDQISVINPFLILLFIPTFSQLVYPSLGKVGLLRKPLQRLTVGGVLAGVAFIISGLLEIQLKPTYAVKLASNQSHLNFINGLDCPVEMQLGSERITLDVLEQRIFKQIASGEYTAKLAGLGDSCRHYNNLEYKLKARDQEARSFLISGDGFSFSVRETDYPDTLEKDNEGDSRLKVVFVGFQDESKGNTTIQFKRGSVHQKLFELPEKEVEENGMKRKPIQRAGIPVAEFDSKTYKLLPFEQIMEMTTDPEEINGVSRETFTVGRITPRQGGNYLYLVRKEGIQLNVTEYIITPPNSIHMAWIIPQYAVITVGEVMFSVTGLEFAFSQAPPTMKSVLQAAWLLTVAFGNVIVVFIERFLKFPDQSSTFFLYAGLMFVDMIIFAGLAYKYKPMEEEDENGNRGGTVEMAKSRRMDGEYRDP